jgi:hypothetical protein
MKPRDLFAISLYEIILFYFLDTFLKILLLMKYYK